MQRNTNQFSDIDTRAGLEAYLGNTNSFQSRDTYDTFGWLEDPNEEEYYATWLRNPIANAIVNVPAETTWREHPEITDSDEETETEFDRKVKTLNDELDVFSYFNRIDKLAGIGEYGVLLIGFKDDKDLDEPVDESKINGPEDIAWLRPFPQISIDNVDLDTDQESDRWGKPELYDLDLDDADDADEMGLSGDIQVHHSRVIHVPSTELLDDEVRGNPRLEPVLNPILDIEKVYGSASEMTYRGADYGLHIDVDPEYDFDPDDLNEELQRYVNQLQNFIRTQGADVEALGGEVTDPSNLLDALMSMVIAGAPYAPPKRMLMGSEQAELASSQDVANYYGKISERQTQYAETYIARRFYDRLISFGALPTPQEIYDLNWPNLFELNEKEEAEVMNTRAKALKNLAPQGNTDLLPGGQQALLEFMETGEYPDVESETTEMQPLDESNPDTQEYFRDAFANAELPPFIKGTKHITRNILTRWVLRVAGQQNTNDWNPALHPRDPETGKFVERSFPAGGVTESMVSDTPSSDLLLRLSNAGENVDEVLSNNSVSIDGVPEQINNTGELKTFVEAGEVPGESKDTDLSEYEGDKFGVNAWSGSLARTALNRMVYQEGQEQRFGPTREKLSDQFFMSSGDSRQLKLTDLEQNRTEEALREYKEVVDRVVESGAEETLMLSDPEQTQRRLQTAIAEFGRPHGNSSWLDKLRR